MRLGWGPGLGPSACAERVGSASGVRVSSRIRHGGGGGRDCELGARLVVDVGGARRGRGGGDTRGRRGGARIGVANCAADGGGAIRVRGGMRKVRAPGNFRRSLCRSGYGIRCGGGRLGGNPCGSGVRSTPAGLRFKLAGGGTWRAAFLEQREQVVVAAAIREACHRLRRACARPTREAATQARGR